MNRRRRGQAMIETALILAALMAVVFGITSLGEIIFVRQTLVERAHDAARWGAIHPYDARAIRNLVLYGTTTPASDARPLVGLETDAVQVSNPSCPGPDCRVSVTILGQGVRSVEPVE